MKKIFALLPCLALLVACQEEPSPYLPDPDPSALRVVVNPTSSGLTTDDLAANTTVKLTIANRSETYDVEIGKGTYFSSKHNEMMLKDGSYFKSVSEYTVDRLIVDFYEGQSGNFAVYANAAGSGEAVTAHESKVQASDPDDGGKVWEYKIDSTGWMLKNTQYKAGIYSITVVFSI